MPAPAPVIKSNSDIKSRLLQPSLTSHFQAWLEPPEGVRQYYDAEQISLACHEAALPGSSLMTAELPDDYTGVMERLAYRRQHDDRATFTFYVDLGGSTQGAYSVIWFFEKWIQYAVNDEEQNRNKNYFYRAKYSDEYRSAEIYINKFEREMQGTYLAYTFLQAYPTEMITMPVKYTTSELLMCTVSFVYNRYVVERLGYGSGNNTPRFAGNPAQTPVNQNTNAPSPQNPNNRPINGAVYNDFLNGDQQRNGRAIGNPALDQFGVRDQLGRSQGLLG